MHVEIENMYIYGSFGERNPPETNVESHSNGMTLSCCETWATYEGLLANICWHKQPISRGQPDILMSLW